MLLLPAGRLRGRHQDLRPPGPGHGQYLVYSMNLKAGERPGHDPPHPDAQGVQGGRRHLHQPGEVPRVLRRDADRLPRPRAAAARAKDDSPKPQASPPKLKVVEVGSFVASFVPAVKDFSRLDEQFRLPDGTWDKLPQYKDYGFAVFKLKKGEQKVHPMAFEFPRADKRRAVLPDRPHPRRQGPRPGRVRPRPVLPGGRYRDAVAGVAAAGRDVPQEDSTRRRASWTRRATSTARTWSGRSRTRTCGCEVKASRRP